MELNFRVVSHLDQFVDREIDLTLGEGGITFGRNPSNDLLLEDPERVVSSHHGRIDLRDGGVWLTDTSSNGTYLNFAQEPLPSHQPVALYDGDLFSVGSYDIRVGFSSAAQAPMDLARASEPGPSIAELSGVMTPHASADILDLIAPGDGETSPLEAALGLEEDLFGDASVLDDKLAGPAPEAPASTTPPRHTPVEHVFFKPLDPRENEQAPSVPPTETHQVFPEHYDLLSDSWGAPNQSDEQGGTAPLVPVAADMATTVPFPDAGRQLDLEPSVPAPRVPDPAPPEVESSRPDPEPPVSSPVLSTPPRRPEPPRPRPVKTASQRSGELESFIEGLASGSVLDVSDAQDFLKRSGALLRELATGLTRTMMARARFKSELRLGVTTIRPSENNPFKFSSDAEDILGRLLFRPSPGFSSAVPAAREAFDDIQAHEMAMTAGLQAALRALLGRFDPDALERMNDRKSGLDQMLPMAYKARCWDLFCELHAQLEAEASEDVMKLFGDIFTQAYQEQVRCLRASASSGRS